MSRKVSLWATAIAPVILLSAPLVAIISLNVPSSAEARVRVSSAGAIMQLYTYRLRDRGWFERGYREHLAWHAAQRDRLAWHAWTVTSGPRRGQFIDGTAGVTLRDLDQRPDPRADARDFARTVGASAENVDVELWEGLRSPSTPAPLENRRPGRFIDVFLITIRPDALRAFEDAVTAVGQHGAILTSRLTWYRRLRGGLVPTYMLMVQRDSWSELDTTGRTLPELLERTFRTSRARVDAIMAHAASITVETWTYEPRLALMPGEPLAQ